MLSPSVFASVVVALSREETSGENPVFLKTPAVRIGDIIKINSKVQAKNWAEVQESDRLHGPKSWWVIASAAFIFETSRGRYVALVERIPKLKWALIPAGTSDTVEELRHPWKALEREAQEELILYRKNIGRICPLGESQLLTTNKISVYDEANGKRYTGIGELHHGQVRVGGVPINHWFLMRAYLVEAPLENLIICDGETWENGEYLNRRIALVPLDSLEGEVEPLALDEKLEKVPKRKIDLTGYQTPTLEWFREMKSSYACMHAQS